MGARANLVLIDGDGLRLHYSHWGADGVCSALVAGPAAGSRFIAAQHRCNDPKRDWLDDVWAEGGAVVDHTTRRLVFYGDQLMLELPEKRAFMALLELTWPGWIPQWAYDGIGDLAAAAGVDRSVVRAPDDDERDLPDETETDLDQSVHLFTVRTAGGIIAYPLWQDVHTAWQGPDLLDHLPVGGRSRLELPRIPESGLHVDVDARVAGVWLRGHGTGLVPALPELWPGWRVEFWQDRYEEHVDRCSGRVTAPPVDLITALDNVISSLDARRGDDPVPAMLNLAQAHTGDQGSVDMNPYFTIHRQLDPTEHEWMAVLHAAAELRTRRRAVAPDQTR